jgi:hypothetical protein
MAPATRPNQISQWKQQLLTTAAELFEERSGKEKEQQEALIDELYKKIGQYLIELDWPSPRWLKKIGL